MTEIIQILFFFLIIVPSSILHEYAHAWAADQLGDPTARHLGRLTLNPVAHIDVWGTIILPLFLLLSTGGRFLFAYAKPVPYNPYNLNNRRWGPALVGVAGPAANLFLAVVFSLIIKLIPITLALTLFGQVLSLIVYANVLLAIFNLVPIPPLDGSKILFAMLPKHSIQLQENLERYGTLILIGFLFFGFGLIMPIVHFVFGLLIG